MCRLNKGVALLAAHNAVFIDKEPKWGLILLVNNCTYNLGGSRTATYFVEQRILNSISYLAVPSSMAPPMISNLTKETLSQKQAKLSLPHKNNMCRIQTTKYACGHTITGPILCPGLAALNCCSKSTRFCERFSYKRCHGCRDANEEKKEKKEKKIDPAVKEHGKEGEKM